MNEWENMGQMNLPFVLQSLALKNLDEHLQAIQGMAGER